MDGENTIPEPEFLAVRPENVTFKASREVELEATVVTNLGIEQAREALIEIAGCDPDQLDLEQLDGSEGTARHSRSRTQVGFRRWNSSWDPKGDPNLN